MKPGVYGLWLRFVVAMAYLALVSGFLSMMMEYSVVAIFFRVVGVALVCDGLGLIWLYSWARRKESQLGQFTVGSLFLLTAYIAIYFSVVEWIVTNSQFEQRRGGFYAATAIVCLWLAATSIPFMAYLGESLVWFASWTVRLPLIRCVLVMLIPRLGRRMSRQDGSPE